mmetsp:Transcript_23184/g.72544  ORF Transcript_23184/g.72544 Transcript_23184/m.72544 type:complete len:260 (+) Transcript_23184:1848-2627(+)
MARVASNCAAIRCITAASSRWKPKSRRARPASASNAIRSSLGSRPFRPRCATHSRSFLSNCSPVATSSSLSAATRPFEPLSAFGSSTFFSFFLSSIFRSFLTRFVVTTVVLSQRARPFSCVVAPSSSDSDDDESSSLDDAQSSESMSSKFFRGFSTFAGFFSDSADDDESSSDESSSDESESESDESDESSAALDADASSASGFSRYAAIFASYCLLWRRSVSFMRFSARPLALDILACAALSLSAASRKSSRSASALM